MLKEETEYSPVRNPSETIPGFFVSRVKAFAALLLFISLVIVLIVLAVLLVKQKGKQELVNGAKGDTTAKGSGEESSRKPMSCDVVVVGGGISGLYMAETVMRRNKEDDVCLFEKEPRFGGRNFDVTFSRAPNVSLMLGSWRIDTAHKKVINLARRLNVPMFKMPAMKVDYLEGRGVYADSFQSFKERAFPTLLSGPFANMTPSEMITYVWMNMSKQKALEVPSYQDFLRQRVGNEARLFLNEIYGVKIDYARQTSTLFLYEYKTEPAKKLTDEYLRPKGGISEISNALETSAKRFGVKMYARERVRALNRIGKGNMFAVHTEHFLVSAKKLIIAVPVYPFKEIIGDVASDIKSNRLFTPILPRSCFKAVAIYQYPWWENATSSHNITLKSFQRYVSSSTCLMWMMPYSGRGLQGEGIIQLTYGLYGCAVKWGEVSKFPNAVFQSELRKAVEAVFPGMVIPEPLDIVFKYWEKTCWHQTKAGSNVSRSEIEEWAKRPLPGEEIYMVGEAFSLIDSWNEGSLRSAYIALKEGWEIASPEP